MRLITSGGAPEASAHRRHYGTAVGMLGASLQALIDGAASQ